MVKAIPLFDLNILENNLNQWRDNMKILNDNDFKLLKKLISLNQCETKSFVAEFLDKSYSDIVETSDYIFAKGNIPIALVAHMDTVFEGDGKKRDFIYRTLEGKLWNPNGAGFDDKAGIFAIFKIIEDGYLPHVIFTTDEEIGSQGAIQLIEEYKSHPFDDLKYLVELDRANEFDCVFYDCKNEEFIEYVESFGFIKAYGTSSDIKHISNAWNIASVNLSIGYKYQHTEEEILYVGAMFETISNVKSMLDDSENISWEFKHLKGT